ncbi:MAG: hypothetical protein IJL69_00510, partial [Oscillospiraceae bacterium]|nr:hypothetical protein [Oscillospiraceae bacterium]
GVSTPVTGELGDGMWRGTEADEIVPRLVGGASPVYRTDGGEVLADPAVAEKIEAEPLADGSRRYTVTLRSDLTWSDGTPVRAEQYVASILFFSLPGAEECSDPPGARLVGAADFAETGLFSGVRLLGENVFSVTVAAQFVPLTAELRYLDVSPMDTALWLPEDVAVVDSEEGCAFEPALDKEDFYAAVGGARTAEGPRRATGPYSFAGFEDGRAVLVRNAAYRARSESERPVIDRLAFVETDGSLSALENGYADILIGLRDAWSAAQTAAAGGAGVSVYGGETLTELVLQCDFGPTSRVEVRRALAYLADRETLAPKMCGDGALVPAGTWSDSLWMSRETEFSFYAPGRDSAVGALVAGGWNLNAQGQSYTAGLRYRAVTAAEAENCPDTVVLDDGRILMPLILRMACGADESGHALFLADLARSAEAVGMLIQTESFGAAEMRDRLARNAAAAVGYAKPLYHGFVVESPVSFDGDFSARWTSDWRAVSEGRNPCRLFDVELDRLAVGLTYGAESREEMLDLWRSYTARWMSLAPEIPLGREAVCDVYAPGLKGYEATDLRGFARAVLSAWIEAD